MGLFRRLIFPSEPKPGKIRVRVLIKGRIGAGWHEPEYRAFGFPFDRRVGRLEEALQIISALLRKGHVDFEGRFYSARGCELPPRGPRPEGPPILIGAQRPRMLRLAATYADIYDADFHLGPDTVAKCFDALDAACPPFSASPSPAAR